MKTKFFLFSAVLFFSAVQSEAQKLQLGPKIGLNFSKLNGEDWDSGYKTSFLAGAFAGISGKRFGVNIEAFYSQAGYTTGKDFKNLASNYYNNIKDSAKQGSFSVSYINIPVLLDLKLLNRVWFQVGPQFSNVLSIKDNDHLLKDTKDVFKSGDVSGILGLQINLPAHLVLNGRYVFGFGDINKTGLSDSWKQRLIQISLGFNFL